MTRIGQPVLEALVDALPLGVLVFDRGGRVHLVNRQAQTLLDLNDPGAPVQDVLDVDPRAASVDTTCEGLVVEEVASPDPELRVVTVRPSTTPQDAIGPYVAMLGHELRNPLAPLRLAAAHLRNADVDRNEACAIIDRQVAHLARLVDDLLDTARLAHGRLVVERRRIQVLDTVRAALQSARARIEARSQTLHTDIEGLGDTELDADPVRLAQALTNLLANAAQYTPPHGTVHLRGRVERGAVVLEVEDDGRGIEPDALESIFDTFAQRNRSTSEPSAGLGLGLGLARRIVRLHGGTLHAESEGVGRGARFTMTLPGAAEPTERPPDAAPSRPPMPVSRRSVLIIDDNEDAGAMLAVVLESQGARCNVVHSGEAAVEAMNAELYDVAVVDIGLPDIDGFEVARRIAASPTRPQRLVALSGYGQQRDRDAAAEAGFDDYYVKPLAAEALGELLG